MIATFDLQSRGLDPQAPLNEAETKLHAANSRLADMAVLAVQRLQRISKNLQRENLELWRVRLPELEPRALQLRRVLAVVRDRSDKLVARLSAKAEERPTLEKFALSFGVSAKDLADFRGARAAVLKQLSRAKDELDLYRNWFSRARGWVEEDQSQWKPEPAWAPCPSPGAGGDLETGRLTPETQDPDSDTDTPKTRLSSTGCPATQLQAGQVQVPSVEGFHYKTAITMLGGKLGHFAYEYKLAESPSKDGLVTDQSPGACAVVAEGTEVSLAYNTPYPASPGADETAGDNVTGGDLPGFGPGPNEVAGADEMSEGDLRGFGPDPNEGTGGANIADGDLPGFGPPVDDGNATTVADGELPGFGDSETDAGSGPGLGNLGQGDTEYLPDDEQAQVAPVQGSVGLVPDLSGILPSSVWDDAFDAGTLETSSDAAPGVAQPLPQAPRPAAPRSGVDVMDQARQDQARQIAAEAAADRQKNPPAPN